MKFTPVTDGSLSPRGSRIISTANPGIRVLWIRDTFDAQQSSIFNEYEMANIMKIDEWMAQMG